MSKKIRSCPVGILPLTKGAVAKLDYEDWLVQKNFNWHLTCKGYAARNVKIGHLKYKYLLLHRAILFVPEGMDIDHINKDPLDNTRANLRVCSRSENMFNKKIYKSNKLGLKGVYPKHGRFCAVIQSFGKRVHLGYFDTPLEASAAYEAAAIKHFGNFAKAS
jgi:hypothetical protein